MSVTITFHEVPYDEHKRAAGYSRKEWALFTRRTTHPRWPTGRWPVKWLMRWAWQYGIAWDMAQSRKGWAHA